MLCLVASAIAATPLALISLFSSNFIVLSDLLCEMASARANAPISPIRLSPMSTVTRDLLCLMASAMAIAPASPILLPYSTKPVSELLCLMASAMTDAPITLIELRLRLIDVLFLMAPAIADTPTSPMWL